MKTKEYTRIEKLRSARRTKFVPSRTTDWRELVDELLSSLNHMEEGGISQAFCDILKQFDGPVELASSKRVYEADQLFEFAMESIRRGDELVDIVKESSHWKLFCDEGQTSHLPWDRGYITHEELAADIEYAAEVALHDMLGSHQFDNGEFDKRYGARLLAERARVGRPRNDEYW